jgi:dolichol-phosphate mannosyltransferase
LPHLSDATLTLVCPEYNEAENIPILLEQLASKVQAPFELMVVYDSEDDTGLPVLDKLESRYSFTIRRVKNRYGSGALHAVMTGLEAAQGTAVLVIMADLADDLSIVDQLYGLIVEDGYDLVAGSRYMPGGKQLGGPMVKGMLSRLAGKTLHWLTGIPTCDVTNNYKMYRISMLKEIPIESTAGFEIAMELTVKAYIGGYRITEIPSVWIDRTSGVSRFRLWKWIPHYLRWYWYALCHRPGAKRKP